MEEIRKNAIAENLRLLRKSCTPKLSQERLARNLGISRSSYAQYETGKRVPKAPVLYRAAQYFGITMEELLGDSQAIGKRGEETRKREKL